MKNTTWIKDLCRIILGIFMLFAGISHLTFSRGEFQAQVPEWLPMGKDFVVIASGIVEIILGLLLLFYAYKRREVGIILAIFFLLIFPGNINQYVQKIDAFGLNTDTHRLIRLFFQPVLIVLALWCSGFWSSKKSSS